jgi:acyl-CoA thioester hydrolase
MTKPLKNRSVIETRIYYEDTDAAGVFNHGRVIQFAERGRTEWLRELGYDHPRLLAEFGMVFVVRHIDISYLAPGRLDDVVMITTEAPHMGNTSVTMHQTIARKDEKGTKTLAELKVTVVAIKPTGQPVRIPPQLRQIFEGISGVES